MKKVYIFDYGVGNIMALHSALSRVFDQVETICSMEDLYKSNCEYLVLPGVGAAESAMVQLHPGRFSEIYNRNSRLKILGICLGMQLLTEFSEEGPGVKTLGLLRGTTKKFSSFDFGNAPRIGWFQVAVTDTYKSTPFGVLRDIPSGAYFYFAHSYAVANVDPKLVESLTGEGIVSSISGDRIFGVQFHPEKSGELGLQVLRNFASVR